MPEKKVQGFLLGPYPYVGTKDQGRVHCDDVLDGGSPISARPAGRDGCMPYAVAEAAVVVAAAAFLGMASKAVFGNKK